ncbi:MAG: thioredoxin domain-containing protein, partial [Zetaproteobacteria bacterium]|nr:thioredoxin domain-containing protein [Pseudobdellovibrionaceae bacterium]
FEKAKKENKLILLSIGYSTCHWCHVMEKESFEDLEIARFLNENYVSVKVDREVRPDIDALYMQAVNVISGRGGWPMTVILTPDKQPFFAGTYFPARDGDRGTRKGFFSIIQDIHKAYKIKPMDILAKSQEILNIIKRRSQLEKGPIDLESKIEKHASDLLKKSFDSQHGGFGQSPKFPRPSQLFFLLRSYKENKNEAIKKILIKTLDKMAQGGIYDHLGGGFHRYATDRKWKAPHFEKMLYDNAQLALLYIEAYVLLEDHYYAQIAKETLSYLLKEMKSPHGGFYSASDADSITDKGHSEEGYFFTWTYKELKNLLHPKTFEQFTLRYNIDEKGNFEMGRNILFESERLDVSSFSRGQKDFEHVKKKLYQHRSERAWPLIDKKILVGWNGLMLSALAKAAFVFEDRVYQEEASELAQLISQKDEETQHLFQLYHDGKAYKKAYLSDYAYLIRGLIDLYETNFNLEWLSKAIDLQKDLDLGFWDKKDGGYFLSASWHEKLATQIKDDYDGAVPTGNSVAAQNLLRLYEYTTDESYKKKAINIFYAFSSVLKKNPSSLVEMLCALNYLNNSPFEIILIDKHFTTQNPFLHSLRFFYLPNKIVSKVTEGLDLKQQEKIIPLLENKVAIKGKPTAYICRNKICKKPTLDTKEFLRQLESM